MLNLPQDHPTDYARTESLLQELADLHLIYGKQYSLFGSYIDDALKSYKYFKKKRLEGDLNRLRPILRLVVQTVIRSLRNEWDFKIYCEIARFSPKSKLQITFQTDPKTNEWGDVNAFVQTHRRGLSECECRCVCLCLNVLSALLSELCAMEAIATPDVPPLRELGHIGVYCFPNYLKYERS